MRMARGLLQSAQNALEGLNGLFFYKDILNMILYKNLRASLRELIKNEFREYDLFPSSLPTSHLDCSDLSCPSLPMSIEARSQKGKSCHPRRLITDYPIRLKHSFVIQTLKRRPTSPA